MLEEEFNKLNLKYNGKYYIYERLKEQIYNITKTPLRIYQQSNKHIINIYINIPYEFDELILVLRYKGNQLDDNITIQVIDNIYNIESIKEIENIFDMLLSPQLAQYVKEKESFINILNKYNIKYKDIIYIINKFNTLDIITKYLLEKDNE